MPLRQAQEPETLSGIVEASFRDRSVARRSAHEEKLKDIDSDLLLKKLTEFVVTESHRVHRAFAWSIGLLLSLNFLILMILLVCWLMKKDVDGLLLAFGSLPSGFLELIHMRRKSAVFQATKKVILLARKLKSGSCVSPLLDILGSGVDSAQNRTELIECLRIPLNRLDSAQVAQLTSGQLKTLEKLVMDEPNEHITLGGILVLGSAGYRVAEWETMLSWARTPTKHGAAAREYLVSVGGVVR